MALTRPPRDASRAKNRLGLSVTFWTIAFVVLMGRFFYLQIVEGEHFVERARISLIERERIPARRGLIKDRNGVVLAYNVPSYQVTLTPRLLPDEERDRVLERLGEVLSLTEDESVAAAEALDKAHEKNKLWEPIVVKRELVGDTCPGDGTPLELLDEPTTRHVCPMCGATHQLVPDKPARCPHDRARIRWQTTDGHEHGLCGRCGRNYVTATTCPVDFTPLQSVVHNLVCPVTGRSHTNQVAVIESILHELPGVDTKTGFRRSYPFGYEAAHLLGYMNRVRPDELKKSPGAYEPTDVVGRRGLERTQEAGLRGAPGEMPYLRSGGGKRLLQTEASGLVEGYEYRPARNGDDYWLTIDINLQRDVRKAFRYYKSGAAIVIEPHSGEVLAMYSKPGFDSNEWSGRLSKEVWEATTSNPFAPLLNKAVTPYHPGSVYKIVTASAALVEVGLSPDLTIHCPGHIDYYGHRFHCHERSGHGPVNLVGALKHSCDVYFYRIGDMLGMPNLVKYGLLYGFGTKTGLELGERPGIVPTRKYYQEHTRIGWQPGHVVGTAIGQGALTTSPAQVARAFAALANGGRVLELHLIKQVFDGEGNLLRQVQPKVLWELGIADEKLALIREGLVRVVNDRNGTASDIRMSDIVIAGKTGTAEAAESRPGAPAELKTWLEEDHAWFSAYAPAEDPQVVIVVFVEHGGGGARIAAPIAQRILKAWMRRRLYRPAAVSPEPPAELDEDDVQPPDPPALPDGADDGLPAGQDVDTAPAPNQDAGP